jgi:hypothetical protein
MASTLFLVAALALTGYAALVIWRVTRRVSPASYLEDATVSRQWLMQHRVDDDS